MASIFVAPIPPSRSRKPVDEKSAKKRKRSSRDDLGTHARVEEKQTTTEEYAAVLSPDERSQRRLAGYSLLNDLPSRPFPHKSFDPKLRAGSNVDQPDSESLRLQHVSAISTVLHKCLLKKDYPRARRALGLLLRTDINGKSIDIRAAGNWTIAAELLLRQFEAHDTIPHTRATRHDRLKRGFEEAKKLYELLIIQYSYQKPHPDSVSAVDFHLAMFNLSIFAAQAEGRELQFETPADDLLSRHHELKERELEQANEIAISMDNCIVAPPYTHNTELLRLRAMVSEWQADLNDECHDLLPPDSDSHVQPPEPVEDVSLEVQGFGLNEQNAERVEQYSQASKNARKKAQQLYDRIGRRGH